MHARESNRISGTYQEWPPRQDYGLNTLPAELRNLIDLTFVAAGRSSN